MIAVAWADWNDFRAQIALFAWGLTGILVAAAVVVGGLRPEYVALSLPGAVFILGWAMGSQRWNARKAWDWASESRVSTLGYLLGKCLGFLGITLATVAFVSPLILLVVLVSGVSLSALLWTLAWLLVLGFWPLLVASLTTQGTGPFVPFLALVMLVLFLVETSALPDLRVASPFMQLWSLYQTGEGWPGAAALLGHLVALVGLGALNLLVYRLNPRFH